MARDCESALEIRLRFRGIGLRRFERNLSSNAIDIGVEPSFLARFHRRHCCINALPSLIELPEVCVGAGQR